MLGVPTDDLLTTPAAARIIGVTDETMRRWADASRVRHIRLPSGQLRFRRSDVEALLEPTGGDAA